MDEWLLAQRLYRAQRALPNDGEVVVDAFESAGEWWLPEAPEEKVIGLLTYAEADGFRLRIPFGCLGDPFGWITSEL